MLTVAIASENDAYDGAVFGRLLSLLLGQEVERWRTDLRIVGHKAVVGLADPFLRRAVDAGVKHALLAVDNDGGSRAGPEHEPEHDLAAQAADDDGCRTCRVLHATPPWWHEGGRRFCAAVPVQMLETWLLHVRGHVFAGEPERTYHRWALKKAFFGKPMPPEDVRLRLALEQVNAPNALQRLRERRSFRAFEEQVTHWV